MTTQLVAHNTALLRSLFYNDDCKPQRHCWEGISFSLELSFTLKRTTVVGDAAEGPFKQPLPNASTTNQISGAAAAWGSESPPQ